MDHEHPLGEPGELAALYVAGAMTPAQASEFESHLAECEVCLLELRSFEPVIGRLTADEHEVPASIKQELMRRIESESAPTESQPNPQIWRDWFSDSPDQDTVIRNAMVSGWEETGIDGIQLRRLSVDRQRDQMTALVRMAPGTSYPGHVHNGPEECLVLQGDLRAGKNLLVEGDYQRMASGSEHGIQSTENGCLLLIVSSLGDDLV